MSDFHVEPAANAGRTAGTLLHISPLAEKAGCEMDSYRIIRALPQWRHEVIVLHTRGEMSQLWEETGAVVVHLDCLHATPLRFIDEIRSAVRDRKFSGVLLWSRTRFLYLLHALRALDLPVGIHVGNPVVNDRHRQMVNNVLERALAPIPRARLLACSQHVYRSLQRDSVLGTMPAHVIYNPVGTPKVAHTPRALDRLSPVRIGMVARLDPIKDHATVLRAWPRIVAALPGATLEFLGDGVLRTALEGLARSLGIERSVHFRRHVSEVAAITREWDVFVYATTEQEGLGNALAEAQAIGLPAVVCDLPMMREVCGEVGGAVYFRAGDANALADAVVHLVPDLAGRREMGAKAREHARRIFDPAACARRHLDVLGLGPEANKTPASAPRARGSPSIHGPRRILHISPLAMQAGCEMNCLRIIEALPDYEHEVLVLAGEGPMTAKWRRAGAEVHHLQVLEKRRAVFFAELKRHLEALPQAPGGVMYWSTTRLPLVMHALRALRAPVVSHVGNPSMGLVHQNLRAWFAELRRPPAPGGRLAVCSDHVFRSLANSSYLRRFPAEVIFNPVEVPSTTHTPRVLDPSKPVRLGMVARIDPIKDHETVLRALCLLRRQFPRITMEFAGDGENRPAMERLAAQLGLGYEVRFLGHVGDVNTRLLDWDLFLYSTTELEGLGNALIEAQAAGLPCVVSDLPMMREVGGRDGGCVYYQAGHAGELAAAAATLLADEAQRRRLSALGRARVARLFSPGVIARRYLHALGLSPEL